MGARKPTDIKKPVVKKSAPHRAGPKKLGPKKPRKLIKKRNVASKMGKTGPAARNGGPLERATFGSPICADRAAVMQAFGLDDMNQPLGEEFAQAIDDALAPQDTTFASGGFNQGGPGTFTGLVRLTFPMVPGGGGGGGGQSGPGNPNTPGNPGEPGGPGNPTNPVNPGNSSGPGNPTPPIVSVPETASWVMMIFGFGFVGSLRWRRSAAWHA